MSNITKQMGYVSETLFRLEQIASGLDERTKPFRQPPAAEPRAGDEEKLVDSTGEPRSSDLANYLRAVDLRVRDIEFRLATILNSIDFTFEGEGHARDVGPF